MGSEKETKNRLSIQCVACGSSEVTGEQILSPHKEYDRECRCLSCGARGGRLDYISASEALLYPKSNGETLLRYYSPVEGLVSAGYKTGDIVQFRTVRRRLMEAEVLHVSREDNVLVIRDLEGDQRRRLLMDRAVFEEEYRGLPAGRKNSMMGWKHRAVRMVSEPTL